MSEVRGKKILCKTNLNDLSIESVNELPFYERYDEFRNVFKKVLPNIDFDALFAQPVKDGNELVWHIPSEMNGAILTDSSDDGSKIKIKSLIDRIKEAVLKADENTKRYLNVILSSNSVIYSLPNGDIFMGIWGVKERIGHPLATIITELDVDRRVHKIQYVIEGKGSLSFTEIHRKHGHILQGDEDIPVVTPANRYKHSEWKPNPSGYKVLGDITFNAVCEPDGSCMVKFKAGGGGRLEGATELIKMPGELIGTKEIPEIIPEDGYKFTGWSPVIETNIPISEDCAFTALFEKEDPVVISDDPIDIDHHDDNPILHKVTFVDGGNGTIEGKKDFFIEHGKTFDAVNAPKVTAKDAYEFTGWDKPFEPIETDTVYTACYKKTPWYRRLWLWLTGKGCLKWLLWFLLILLLLILLFYCIGSCNRCTRDVTRDDPSEEVIIDEPDREEIWTRPDPFDNGDSHPIHGEEPVIGDPITGNPITVPPVNPEDPGFGLLPDYPNRPLPVPDDDIIDDEDGRRKIVANRLNVLLDDDSLSITEFAQDFKAAYPGEQYQIVYADNLIKRLQLMVPSDEREKVKRELVGRLPEKYTPENVFIWDEALFEGYHRPNDARIGECWYLDAIRAYPAWDMTMGNDSIIVAIVDDGFSLTHEELEGKVVMPYNVYTQNTDVSESEDKHGSHVAGLAVGKADNQKGIAGIAPNCKLMPVKISDEYGNMTTTGIVDGVLYSVYKGASVVNLSLGMWMQTNIPVEIQEELIRHHFKEEERLWNKVFEMASKKNTTIVIAAGNEDLLAGIDPMRRGENVIVVAAVDKYHNPVWGKSIFSNYGVHTDISAPGVDILSSVGNNDYEFMSGTSMAAPIASGAVALMKSVNPDLNTAQIRFIFQETGLPVVGDIGKLIQLDKALEMAKNFNADSIPAPQTGDVQIQLKWHNFNDLDIACTDPFGQTVNFRNKHVPSGGCLDVDMNAGGLKSNQPLENIYWPTGGAPSGNYTVYLKYYARKDSYEDATPYEVFVKYGDKAENYTGTLSSINTGWNKICSFTLK